MPSGDGAASAGALGWPGGAVFSDGPRVGAMLDRNGLRPLASRHRVRLVAAASEGGAIAIGRRDRRAARLGPGEMFVVDPHRRRPSDDAEAEAATSVGALDRVVATRRHAGRTSQSGPWRRSARVPRHATPAARGSAGLDAERQRLDIKTMALEAHEPLWSMGDDTPTPALAPTGPSPTTSARPSPR